MPVSVAQGVKSPEALRITVTGGADLDLTTVTSVNLLVTRSFSGTTSTWVATVQPGATSTQLKAIYSYSADGSDCQELGIYKVEVDLVTTSGTVHGKACALLVEPANTFRLR
jgi:hypothetical protein